MIRSYQGVRPTIPESCYVDESAQVIGDVVLGEKASIWMNAVVRGDVHSIRIGAHVESPDATFEAIAAKQGVALLAAGNAELYSRPGIVSRPVVDLAPAELAIAWRADDDRAIIQDFAGAARQAIAASPIPGRHLGGSNRGRLRVP